MINTGIFSPSVTLLVFLKSLHNRLLLTLYTLIEALLAVQFVFMWFVACFHGLKRILLYHVLVTSSWKATGPLGLFASFDVRSIPLQSDPVMWQSMPSQHIPFIRVFARSLNFSFIAQFCQSCVCFQSAIFLRLFMATHQKLPKMHTTSGNNMSKLFLG